MALPVISSDRDSGDSRNTRRCRWFQCKEVFRFMDLGLEAADVKLLEGLKWTVRPFNDQVMPSSCRASFSIRAHLSWSPQMLAMHPSRRTCGAGEPL